jgi:hypothetical protein
MSVFLTARWGRMAAPCLMATLFWGGLFPLRATAEVLPSKLSDIRNLPSPAPNYVPVSGIGVQDIESGQVYLLQAYAERGSASTGQKWLEGVALQNQSIPFRPLSCRQRVAAGKSWPAVMVCKDIYWGEMSISEEGLKQGILKSIR